MESTKEIRNLKKKSQRFNFDNLKIGFFKIPKIEVFNLGTTLQE